MTFLGPFYESVFLVNFILRKKLKFSTSDALCLCIDFYVHAYCVGMCHLQKLVSKGINHISFVISDLG